MRHLDRDLRLLALGNAPGARAARRFRRYIVFFLAGFLAVYVGQAFISPRLTQVHAKASRL